MKCCFCGTINPPNITFCRRCGALLEGMGDDELIPTEREPVKNYSKAELAKKIEEFEDILYGKKLTRKEFQEKYMWRIIYVSFKFFVVGFLSSLLSVPFAMFLFSEDTFGTIVLTVFLVLSSLFLYIRRTIKKGGAISDFEYKRNHISAENIADYRNIGVFSRNWRYGGLGTLSLILPPDVFLAVCIIINFLYTFFERGEIYFSDFVVPVIGLLIYIILNSLLGKAYDRHKETGKFPKWIEIIDMF